jgi:hypothetical protein
MGMSEHGTAPPPSLQSVLAEWRAAERALSATPPTSDERQRASHEFEVLQAEYQQIASHDGPDQVAPVRADGHGRDAT